MDSGVLGPACRFVEEPLGARLLALLPRRGQACLSTLTTALATSAGAGFSEAEKRPENNPRGQDAGGAEFVVGALEEEALGVGERHVVV